MKPKPEKTGAVDTVEHFDGADAEQALKDAGLSLITDQIGARFAVHPETVTRELDRSKHTAIVVFSTGKYCYRDGCRLVAKGVNMTKFRKNPVVLWSHNYDELPIAQSPRVKLVDEQGGKLVGFPKFHMQTELSKEVWALMEVGVLRAWSLGFIPERIRKLSPKEVGLKPVTDEEEDAFIAGKGAVDLRPGEVRYDIERSELLEYSSVPVPADPDALTDAIRSLHQGGRSAPALEKMLRQAGMKVPELIAVTVKDPQTGIVTEEEPRSVGDAPLIEEWQRVEETEEQIHVPVRSKGSFIADSFRTLSISKDQGIQAVAGKLKSDGADGPMTVQKYLFAKDKGWTVEKATAWVAKHKKALDDWYTRLQEAGHSLEGWDFVECDGLVPVPHEEKVVGDQSADLDTERAGKVISKATEQRLMRVANAMETCADELRSLVTPAKEEKAAPPVKAPVVTGDALRAVLEGATDVELGR